MLMHTYYSQNYAGIINFTYPYRQPSKQQIYSCFRVIDNSLFNWHTQIRESARIIMCMHGVKFSKCINFNVSEQAMRYVPNELL